MFPNRTPEDKNLQTQIDRIYIQLSATTPDAPDYSVMVDQLTKLYALKEDNSQSRISMDALLAVIGNLAGIGIIVGHERIHVVTSKALAFAGKLR